jgi:hypothetical protein
MDQLVLEDVPKALHADHKDFPEYVNALAELKFLELPKK